MFFFKKNLIRFICILSIAMFYPSSAFAHKVMIFGWVEDGQVKTISKFSGGKKVQNAPVSVYTMEEALLLKGKTDEKGEFSFKRPAAGKIKILLEASMGHRASCFVEISDESDEDSFETEEIPLSGGGKKVARDADAEEIRVVIEKALDKKLGAFYQMMAEKEEKKRVADIIGGIGYILGLIGIALWARSR